MRKGEIISADTGSIPNSYGLGSFSYQWQRNGVDIPNAYGSDYELVRADVGCAIRVLVTHIDAQGTIETFTSEATDVFGDVDDDFYETVTEEDPPAATRTERKAKAGAAHGAIPPGRKRFKPKTFTLTPMQIAALEAMARDAYLAGDVKRPDVSAVVRTILDEALGTQRAA